jgi:hypothetical protein
MNFRSTIDMNAARPFFSLSFYNEIGTFVINNELYVKGRIRIGRLWITIKDPAK